MQINNNKNFSQIRNNNDTNNNIIIIIVIGDRKFDTLHNQQWLQNGINTLTEIHEVALSMACTGNTGGSKVHHQHNADYNELDFMVELIVHPEEQKVTTPTPPPTTHQYNADDYYALNQFVEDIKRQIDPAWKISLCSPEKTSLCQFIFLCVFHNFDDDYPKKLEVWITYCQSKTKIHDPLATLSKIMKKMGSTNHVKFWKQYLNKNEWLTEKRHTEATMKQQLQMTQKEIDLYYYSLIRTEKVMDLWQRLEDMINSYATQKTAFEPFFEMYDNQYIFNNAFRLKKMNFDPENEKRPNPDINYGKRTAANFQNIMNGYNQCTKHFAHDDQICFGLQFRYFSEFKVRKIRTRSKEGTNEGLFTSMEQYCKIMKDRKSVV